MRSMILLFAALMVTSCNTKKGNRVETVERLCYIHFENNDTVKMTIFIQDKNVRGELTYKIFEKDRNNGQLQGTFSGDTIIADYEFESEGIKSLREIAFLRKGTTLVEGYAAMDSTGSRFSNRSELTFRGIELHETDCPE